MRLNPVAKPPLGLGALRSALVQRLRRFPEEHGTRIPTPEDRSFKTEGEVIESGFRRTLESRDAVMRSLIRAAYRFRDAAMIAEKKEDFGSALQNPYRELEHAEELVGPHGDFQFRLASQKGQSNEIRIL